MLTVAVALLAKRAARAKEIFMIIGTNLTCVVV